MGWYEEYLRYIITIDRLNQDNLKCHLYDGGNGLIFNLKYQSFCACHEQQFSNNPDYSGVLHIGRFAWVFLSYVI